MLKRAYSFLEYSAVDPDRRTFSGTATSPRTDSYGDVIDPLGVRYASSMPLLLYHNSKLPVGEARFGKPNAKSVPFDAQISTIDRPGVVADRLQEAVDSLNAKPPLIRAVSIGFKELAPPTFIKETGGYHYSEIEVVELSMVVVPANADCTIENVRSFDTRAVPGAPVKSAGVSASTRVVSTRRDTPMKKSYADQIVEFQNTRAAKVARQDAILEKSADAGVTLDAADKEEHDTIAAEVKEIDEHLVRLNAALKREAEAAVIIKGATPIEAAASRQGVRIQVEKKLPPGIQFARYAMCMGMSRGNPYEAKQLARDNYGDDAAGLVSLIDLHQKGAVGALNAQTAGAGSELVPYTIMDDFINYLRPQTILGKLGTTVNVGGSSGTVTYPSLRRVPFNTRVSGFSAGTTATWVGEGLPALLSKGTSTTISLTWSKLAALTVLTKEEVRFSNPAAEAKVRDDLAAAIIQKQDLDFIDPVRAAVANVNPASVTYQTVPILTTGTTAAAFRTDMATLLATFATALLDPSDIFIVMSTVDALNISLMITSLGNPVYPGMTMAGGYLFGFPVVTTKAMVSIGSPSSTIIVAIKAGDIYLADDGVVTVDASDQASIEMEGSSSSQSGITGTGVSQVSLWQTDMIGLKASREINWKLRRTGAARYIYNAAYRT